jgi:hypothetical protein
LTGAPHCRMLPAAATRTLMHRLRRQKDPSHLFRSESTVPDQDLKKSRREEEFFYDRVRVILKRKFDLCPGRPGTDKKAAGYLKMAPRARNVLLFCKRSQYRF